MTSPIQRIPIDPDLYYPVRLLWANGKIREMKGSYLLATENPESWRYVRTMGSQRIGESIYGVAGEPPAYTDVTRDAIAGALTCTAS